eukprot:15339293-Ditylum_brightwellii.AAC.1
MVVTLPIVTSGRIIVGSDVNGFRWYKSRGGHRWRGVIRSHCSSICFWVSQNNVPTTRVAIT